MPSIALPSGLGRISLTPYRTPGEDPYAGFVRQEISLSALVRGVPG